MIATCSKNIFWFRKSLEIIELYFLLEKNIDWLEGEIESKL